MRYLTYLILVLSTSLNAGEIHKWFDENGNVHYGDSPPAKSRSENVRVQAAPTNPGKALPRLSVQDSTGTATGGDSAGADGTNSNGTDTPAEASDEQARKICQIAREDLDVINRSSRIKLTEANGSTRYLTDAEVAQRKLRSQAEIDRYCE